MPLGLYVEFEDVFVLQDVAALDALAVIARAVPKPGELKVLGDVFVEMVCSFGHRRTDGQDYRVVELNRLAGLLSIDPYDFEHVKQAAPEFLKSGMMFD